VAVREQRSTSGFERWTPLGGLVFVLGWLALTILTPAGDDIGETPADVVAWATKNDDWMAAAAICAVISLPLIGCFVIGLYTRMQRVEDRALPLLTLLGGTMFALLFFLALAIWTMPLVDMGEPKLAEAAAYRMADDIGWLLLGGAGVGAGLMAIGASLVALRTGAVAAWAGWLGVAAGVASFATITFLGLFAWVAWILVVSVALLARGGRST
jgi:uncharacterized membrane protein YgdD (TMEM256/DUF423 family)